MATTQWPQSGSERWKWTLPTGTSLQVWSVLTSSELLLQQLPASYLFIWCKPDRVIFLVQTARIWTLQQS